jgi:hypothetical protein
MAAFVILKIGGNRMEKKKKFIPYNKMTIGQKKVNFVKWLMKQGVSKEKAKLICHYKFYHEK